MLAAVLKQPFKLELEEVPKPTPREDEVLIKVGACGICGSDVRYFQGKNPWALHTLGVEKPNPPDMILGHEVSGTIVEAGDARFEDRIGEKVGIIAYKACGRCKFCSEGRHNLCANVLHIGHDEAWGFKPSPGGMAEYCAVWEDKAVRLDWPVSFEEASQLDGLAVSVHAAYRAQVKPGDRVAVIGSGPIGLMILQTVKAFGASEVFAIDVWDKPLDIAQKLGADHTVDSSKENPVNYILSKTRGRGVEAVVNTVGSPETVVDGLKMLARGGCQVLLAVTSDTVQLDLRLLAGERVLTVSSNNLYREYYTAVSLLKTGRVEIKPFITHVLPLEEVKEAFRIALNKEEYGALKVVIKP
ncbi:alcohol dehydrogenase catalytic domain-containing protein [Candidatus Bathyarchaeota archaeon]|nr:alcohol dehydrogenase catalytic domain-containing protein [Candidatus Bathyarchaeota archaeon]